MKRTLFLCLIAISCSGNANHSSPMYADDYRQLAQITNGETSLDSIQVRITSAFVQSLVGNNPKPMDELSALLDRLYKESSQNLALYWNSYLQFYRSIYHLKVGNRKMAEKEVDKGIDWLKGMDGKNSEDYALLSMLQGYALQFKGTQVKFLSSEVKSNAKSAIAADTSNPRAYYVYASNDFYTPEKDGGGTETEKCLLKALSLPAQEIANTFLPSWGRADAYVLIIQFYIQKSDWEQAKKYFQQASEEFPENHQIQQLATQLVGK